MSIRDFLNVELFTLTGRAVTVGSVVTAFIVMMATLLLSRIARGIVVGALRRSGVHAKGSLGTADRFLYYGFLIVGSAVALTTLGIDLSALFATGAVAAVALAFAMQNILQNFVSGVILLAERSITPADILVVEGETVRVERMGIRSTIVRNRDEEEVIVPNAQLVQSIVKNLTLGDELTRIRSRVGVSYSSDLDEVVEVLTEVAMGIPGRSTVRDPRVWVDEFGDSAIVFEVSIWAEDPWARPTLRTTMNLAIWRGLKKAGITIAFPQLDVHLVSNPARVGVDSPPE